MSRVCVFGDSITWGSWDPVHGGWVGRLREAGCNRVDLSDPSTGTYTAVYNCGVSGDRLTDLLARIDIEARARNPAAIVIAIGINDVAHDGDLATSIDEFRSDYMRLMDKARTHAHDIVLVTPTNVDEGRPEHDYRNSDIQRLAGVVHGAGADAGVPVVDVFGLMTPDDLSPDGLHPGAAGHETLFRTIEPVVFALASLNG